MLTLPLPPKLTEEAMIWRWSHWKADKICFILEGGQSFEKIFDQVFFQTLYFNVILRHVIVKVETMTTL